MPTQADLRSAVAALTTLAIADLDDLWRSVDPADADATRDTLTRILPRLIATYGLASATVAADWYDELRDELDIDARFFAITADLGDTGGEELARWGVSPLYGADPDIDIARTKIAGGLQRRIANAARDTITQSAIADPGALGWQRIGDGRDCEFCTMLISRGAVYTEATVTFASHDHCNCQATPAFRGRPVPVKPYTPSARSITDADRARVRRYLADHRAG